MRLLDIIKSRADLLEESGVPDALADAELLALHAAGIERLRAYIDNPEIDISLRSKINRLVKRRASGEPLQYIIGHVDFLGLEIRVGKGVLIPRPETEMLVEKAIETVRSKALGVKSSKKFILPPSQLFLDLCTGSGCIALALAKEFPHALVFAADISTKALGYARQNAECNKIENVTFLKGSLFGPVEKNMSFDLITVNPPYIMTSDIAGLQREVRDWEPVRALSGGEDGLDFYRKILLKASGYLKENGSIFLELGFGQAEAIKEIADRSGLKKLTILKDFAGIDRILKAQKIREETGAGISTYN
jgi:release factor glutamine methyltransferase